MQRTRKPAVGIAAALQNRCAAAEQGDGVGTSGVAEERVGQGAGGDAYRAAATRGDAHLRSVSQVDLPAISGLRRLPSPREGWESSCQARLKELSQMVRIQCVGTYYHDLTAGKHPASRSLGRQFRAPPDGL